jgi:hypothetical protein
VLLMMAEGLTSAEIGTVRNRAGNAEGPRGKHLRELEVADRTQAVAEALQRGIVHLD